MIIMGYYDFILVLFETMTKCAVFQVDGLGIHAASPEAGAGVVACVTEQSGDSPHGL